MRALFSFSSIYSESVVFPSFESTQNILDLSKILRCFIIRNARQFFRWIRNLFNFFLATRIRGLRLFVCGAERHKQRTTTIGGTRVAQQRSTDANQNDFRRSSFLIMRM